MTRTSIFVSIFMTACASVAGPQYMHSARVGSPAPDFSLKAIDGKVIHLKDLRGHPVLLSFIHVHNSSQSGAAQATRAQMTVLKSMMKQYEEAGLKLVLIEGSEPDPAEEETFVNFIYDHELTFVPLLRDGKRNSVAESYGVDVLPTTFLISATGMISQHWHNTALSGQLALAIESKIEADDDWMSPARLIFPGLPGARQLAERMWMVDGEKTWKHGETQPFRLLIFGEDSVHVKLDVVKEGYDQPVTSVQLVPEAISEAECQVLLSNLSWKTAKACSVVSSLSVAAPGKYFIRVSVSKPGDSRILHTGSMKMKVQ